MEYIDLRGTTYESPAVCKYTGTDHTRLHGLPYLCASTDCTLPFFM